ncbi:hypothetical protein LTR85_003017 [Meristemomyces frigidus]|nr:hypothetical protein LTR85_003017 [Meristemomyces frigidus]
MPSDQNPKPMLAVTGPLGDAGKGHDHNNAVRKPSETEVAKMYGGQENLDQRIVPNGNVHDEQDEHDVGSTV